MRSLTRTATGLALLLVLSAVAVTPAVAHDGDHGGSGAQGPDDISANVQLLSNVGPSAPGVTQTDLAFWGRHAIAGNARGFQIINIANPARPRVVTNFTCNGAQGDVSVWGDLLFQSVDTPQSDGSCGSTNVTASTPGMFEGIRIFDLSDKRNPVHVASIPTDCGSHTHTLLPDPESNRAYIYVSSYPLAPAAIGPNCQEPHGYISIVEVPLDDPAAAQVHQHLLDEDTEVAHYDLTSLGLPQTFSFVACHDMSVFVELELLAGACMSESQLWDISDPLNPELRWRFDDPVVDPGRVDLWHSSTFSWDGSIVAFGDESGGGAAARCVDPQGDEGRIWFVDTATGELLANYKIPRSETGICTMHNFNFVPLRDGRNVLVSSAYTGGTTIVDVDALVAGASEAEAEIGHARLHGGSAWSSYWYDGLIYANDIFRGVDTFRLTDPSVARARHLPFLNPQTQHAVIEPRR